MTPKQKAQVLVDNYIHIMPNLYKQTGETIMTHAKQCAFIAVNNTIDALHEYDNDIEGHLQKVCPEFYSCQLQNMDWDIRYWHQVKAEIQKL